MAGVRLFDKPASPFAPLDKKRLGLYLHVPFCLSKCAYCDFFSYVPRDPAVYERYADALLSHMQSYRPGTEGYLVDTVFVGGGTPTALPPELLIRLLRGVRQNFRLTKGAEFTVEANPATVDASLLRKLRRAGVNRLSMGLQSANEGELAILGRIHRREDFEESFKAARKAKIPNINVDLMFGIPHQTKVSLFRSLEYTVGLEPEHISLYDLILEPGTPLYKKKDTLPFPGEEEEADMYLSAVEFLRRHGYIQYEISNFARPGYQCLHNLKYWNCEEYLGLGVSAHSYFMENRFSFIRDMNRYITGLEKPASRVKLTEENDVVSPHERMGEYIMLRLRLTAGISDREFARRFGAPFSQLYGKKLRPYVEHGFATFTEGTFALTPKGMFVSNYILSDILEFADLGRRRPFGGQGL